MEGRLERPKNLDLSYLKKCTPDHNLINVGNITIYWICELPYIVKLHSFNILKASNTTNHLILLTKLKFYNFDYKSYTLM